MKQRVTKIVVKPGTGEAWTALLACGHLVIVYVGTKIGERWACPWGWKCKTVARVPAPVQKAVEAQDRAALRRLQRQGRAEERDDASEKMERRFDEVGDGGDR